MAFYRFLALVALAGATVACGQLPMASIPALSRVDFMSTQFDALAAAVDLPAPLVVLPDGVTLSVTLTIADGPSETRAFALSPDVGPPSVASSDLPEAERRRRYVFSLPSDARDHLESVRGDIEDARAAGQSGSLSITLTPTGICRAGPVPASPLRYDAYLQTSETQGFVALVRNGDLARDAAATGATIPICP